MQKTGYYFFRLTVLIFSAVPFFLLYFLSDILYLFFYYVLKYRKDVVFKNLRNSFPEKSDTEIRKIAKGFYRHLSDITVESIKGLSMSRKSLLKRYKVVNLELLDPYYEKGQSVIGLAAHYNNWEWGVAGFGYQFRHKSIGLYKPLSNKYIDNYVRKSKVAAGMFLVPIKQTRHTFEEKHEKPAIFLMISDQSPSNLKKAIWVKFLNQDTACLHGAEYYSKKYNIPLIFGNVQRIKRGYYEVKLSVFEDNPRETAEGEITRRFMKTIEEIIKEKPENWLWSHKRWKHKKQ